MDLNRIRARVRRLLAPTSRPTTLAEGAREHALDVITRYGFLAHYYIPYAGCEDRELANACRLLGAAAYIITTSDRTIVGKVAQVRLGSDESAATRRASFKLVVRE